LRSKSSAQYNIVTAEKKSISNAKALWMGFLANVLNPKATLFFLGLFTVVISPETPQITIIISGVMMMINTALWFSVVAIFLTTKRIQSVYYKIEYRLNKIFG